MNTATYKGDIIKFSGGIHEYVGELEQGVHMNGPNWYRIKNPCLIFTTKDPQTHSIQQNIVSLRGVHNTFRKFVDIFVPPESIIEICVADETGDLYKVYHQEIKKEKSIIELPGNSKVVGIGGGISRN